MQVARCTKIINADSDDPKYIINVKQFAKFVVDLADSVAPTDIEEGMRVGVDRNKYQIHIPLPPKIDPTVTMMQVEDKPDVTYSDVGGCKEQIEKLREVVETPLLHPEKFVTLGIEPPKGVLLFGPVSPISIPNLNQHNELCQFVCSLELVKLSVLEPLLIVLMLASFVSLDLSWFKSMSAKVHVWSENSLRWQEARKPA